VNWTDIMAEGGIGLFLLYIVIWHVVVPLVKLKTEGRLEETGSQAKDCKADHGILIEKINGANEARRVEAQLIREALISSATAHQEESRLTREAITGLKDEMTAWRVDLADLAAYLKKERGS